MKSQKGFTLIELLVVIGVIAILAAIVLVAVNPGRQFSQARDTQRRSDLYSITNAIYQYAAEHEGNMPAIYAADETVSVPFPTTTTCIGTQSPCFDLGAASAPDGDEPIVPTYIAGIPEDPQSGTNANTNYYIYMNEETGRIEASATGELADSISVTR